MTRINSAIPVERLTDEQLLAEHLEITHLPYFLGRALQSGSINHIPREFTLGTGHITFFLDKMLFTLNRYNAIREECTARGFAVTNMSYKWDSVPEQYMNDYTPTPKDYSDLIRRIESRIMTSTKRTWHYKSLPISKERAIKILRDES